METAMRIMCVLDSSRSSDDALRYAIAKARQQHAQLTVARVFAADEKQPQDVPAMGDAESRHARSSWSPASEIDVEIACEELHPQGEPADDIVELARQLAVDHIVIGTTGRHRSNRIEMGPTARRVLKAAQCAVTVVNNEDVPQ